MGVKPYKMAKDLGINQGTVGKWVTGKVTPDVKSVIKIAGYVEVSVDYLLGLTDEENEPLPRPDSLLGSLSSAAQAPATTDSELTEDETALLQGFRKLEHRGRTEVLHSMYVELSILEKEKPLPDKADEAVGAETA
jgi:transcriptional regulator with XRE-family HTH domain